jgi:hypothetical protein
MQMHGEIHTLRNQKLACHIQADPDSWEPRSVGPRFLRDLIACYTGAKLRVHVVQFLAYDYIHRISHDAYRIFDHMYYMYMYPFVLWINIKNYNEIEKCKIKNHCQAHSLTRHRMANCNTNTWL